MQRLDVGVGIDGDALEPGLAARPRDPHRDLAAVGDEDAAQRHRTHFGFRFSRKARMPSCPSGETRCSAMRLVVMPMTSPGRLVWISLINDLAAAIAVGARTQDVAHVAIDCLIERRCRHHTMHEAELLRAPGVEASCRQEQLARGRFAYLAEHIRRDDGGKNPQPGLAERKDGIVSGHDDVADRDQADAAAERGTMDAPNQWHRQRVEELEHSRQIFGVAQVVLPRIGHGLHHPGEIGAGAERRSFARKDDGAKGRIAAGVAGNGRQRRDDFFIECVADFGPVEADTKDIRVVAAGNQDGHGRSMTARYMRKTPNFGSGIGAFRAAERPSASAWRVSAGSTIPSSHSRAVE